MSRLDNADLSVSFVHREQGSISSVGALKSELQGEFPGGMLKLASETGVALLAKGALTDETRNLVRGVCDLGWKARTEIEERGAADPRKEALVFSRGLNGMPNALFHAHKAVALVPVNVRTNTVFADNAAELRAYAEVLNDPALLGDLDHALRIWYAPDWYEIRRQITDGRFTNETRDRFINMAGNTQMRLEPLYYRIARAVQICLEGKGQLHEVPWHLADAGIIDEGVPHARDCRTSNERDEQSMLCTWS